jgi:hypothetical protein
MRKTPKAITLHRETLRSLDASRLEKANGGFSLPPTQCNGNTNTNCDACPSYSCGLFQCE